MKTIILILLITISTSAFSFGFKFSFMNKTKTNIVDFFGDNSGISLYQFDANSQSLNNVYNGTANGASYGSGKFVNSLNPLTVGSNYVSLPISPSFFNVNNFSISLWVKMFSLNSGGSQAGNFAFNVAAGNSSLSVYQNTIRFDRFNSGVNYSAIYSAPININQWYHVVITRDSTTGMTLYVDGLLVATNTYTGPLEITSNDVGFGYYNGTGAPGLSNPIRYGFTGSIDQARFFNKTLSSIEVLRLKNEQ